MRLVRALDAHAGGAPARLIVDGAPTPRGRSMRDKTAWMSRHADDLRRMVMLEPRGHRDMHGAMLTEPVSPGSHAGLIFMNADGYAAMAGHTVIAVTTLALTRGLLLPRGDDRTVVYDTSAGTVRARIDADSSSDRRRVSVTNVPSFVLQGGIQVKASGRHVRADVAFGGALYAIVDAESVGLSADLRYLTMLRQVSREVIESIESTVAVVHPGDGAATRLAGTLFTGPPASSDAQLRNITVLRDGSAGRSPSGTGLSAIMAVLDAMGLLDEDATFRQEGVCGETFVGRLAGRTMVGEHPAIVPEFSGSAWITGEHVFLADPADPFRDGAIL
jgi:proline racemase